LIAVADEKRLEAKLRDVTQEAYHLRNENIYLRGRLKKYEEMYDRYEGDVAYILEAFNANGKPFKTIDDMGAAILDDCIRVWRELIRKHEFDFS
jgi:hypothetical protein